PPADDYRDFADQRPRLAHRSPTLVRARHYSRIASVYEVRRPSNPPRLTRIISPIVRPPLRQISTESQVISSSPASLAALTTTTGIACHLGSSCQARRKPFPSRLGISKSRKTRSGRCCSKPCSARSKPCSPSHAVSTRLLGAIFRSVASSRRS